MGWYEDLQDAIVLGWTPNTGVACATTWDDGDSLERSCATLFDSLDPLDKGCGAVWNKATPLDKACEAVWDRATPLDKACALVWDRAVPLDKACALVWDRATPLDKACALVWDRATPLDKACALVWNRATPLDSACALVWNRATPLDSACALVWNRGIILDLGCAILWAVATPLDGNCTANDTGDPTISTGNKGCTIPWIGAGSVIVIAQDITLIRVSDSQEIKLLGSSVSIDIDSWLWSFEAVLASREDINYLRPVTGPIEVEHNINEYVWRFIVEEIEDTYVYGSPTYSIRGRSPSCGLSGTYAPAVTKNWSAITNAVALVTNELDTVPGTNPATGFAPVWEVENWNIGGNCISHPAGTYGVNTCVYSIENYTKIDILLEVANAIGAKIMTVGGFVEGATIEKKLLFYYRYPYSPSTWGAQVPDETIMANHILSQGVRWNPQPKYDHIYVSGTEHGVLRHVKRDSEPWTNAKVMVSDKLVLTEAVARERGRNELNLTGYDQLIHTLTLPLPLATDLAIPKLLFPGELIGVTDLFETWRGQIMSVNIATAQSTGDTVTPGVTMTVEVERHLT